MFVRTPMCSLAGCFLGVSALSVPAAAQSTTSAPTEPSPSQPADPEIIVPGERDAPSQRKHILSYDRAVMSEEPAGQYAKFDDPICPSARGFNDELPAFIEQRILSLAQAADIATAEPGSRTNVLLWIVEDGPTAIKELRVRGKGAFGRMRPYERDRIERGEGPVYKWHLVNPLADDGNQNRALEGAGLANDTGSEGSGPPLLNNEGYNVARTNTKSRILQTVRQGISYAFIVIEKDAILGLSPIQIADFATVMALARVREGESEDITVPSIRTLFANPIEDAEPTLTDWDLALLTSLYKARGNLRASQQRAAMSRTFEKALAENAAQAAPIR